MSRFSRINTVWRKELIDALRDRRTLVAMVLVPMVIYPALMLGSLQALEVQMGQLVAASYEVAVPNERTRQWLQSAIDRNLTERAAESQPAGQPSNAIATVRAGEQQLIFSLFVAQDVRQAVASGQAAVGLLMEGPPPAPFDLGSAKLQIVFDESDIRSKIAADGLHGVLDRDNSERLMRRLEERQLAPEFVAPLVISDLNVATAERVAGAALGQIVPLILIIMTFTGAMYPAIDLTAGERERGTLETLMVAPVPTIDLITGKFIVVALIGMLSAVLNLASVGGTVYLGGVGSLLTQGREFIFPLKSLPLVLVLLMPLAVMFSAMLLAVCSFARSFKEAQNYIVPVMLVALIPGVVGILPGTRLEGPIVIMPVTNIVVLTRELFLGKFDLEAIIWVLLSTSLYAGAAVAVAAKLFGQEAVMFADSGSIRAMFQRRYFKPRRTPSAAQAMLVMAIVYLLNFYFQQAIGRSGMNQGLSFLTAFGVTLFSLLVVAPLGTLAYLKVDPRTTFALRRPRLRSILAALCFGGSTWILAHRWIVFQQSILPMDPNTARLIESQFAWLNTTSPWLLVLFMAILPAVCEELFFRGFALSGLRGGLGRVGAVLVSAIAFGLFHYSAHRMIQTTALGVLFGILVIRGGAIWPAMLAHATHNALTLLSGHPAGFAPLLRRFGWDTAASGGPPETWVLAAGLLLVAGLALCLLPSSIVALRLGPSPAPRRAG